MSTEHIPIPVSTAARIGEDFRKAVVIICAWDQHSGLLHTTTWGSGPHQKQWAASGGEIASEALGALPMETYYEDYRMDRIAALEQAITKYRDKQITDEELYAVLTQKVGQ